MIPFGLGNPQDFRKKEKEFLFFTKPMQDGYSEFVSVRLNSTTMTFLLRTLPDAELKRISSLASRLPKSLAVVVSTLNGPLVFLSQKVLSLLEILLSDKS